MSFDALIGLVQRLGVSVDALAALGANLRVGSEGLKPDPEVSRHLRAVLPALEAGDLDGLTPPQREMIVGAIRAAFKQALDLIDEPARAPGWVYDDPIVLQSQGRSSIVIATLFRRIAPQLEGALERLDADGAAFLDVGTGVGWLAIAMAGEFPRLGVVGVDVWAPALALARANVAAAGLTDRVRVRHEDARELADVAAFDLVWLAGPFLSKAAVPAILDRAHRALRPGGWLVFGLHPVAADPLAQRLGELRAIRSGGNPWTAESAADLLRAHGYAQARALERTWAAPVIFVVGRKS